MRLAFVSLVVAVSCVCVGCPPPVPPPVIVEGEGDVVVGEGEGEEGEGDGSGEGEGEGGDGASCTVGIATSCAAGFTCVSPTLDVTGVCRRSCIVDNGNGQGVENPAICAPGTTCQTQIIIDGGTGAFTAIAGVCVAPVDTIDTPCLGVTDPDSCSNGLTCSFIDLAIPTNPEATDILLHSECKVGCTVGRDPIGCPVGESCGRSALDLFVADFQLRNPNDPGSAVSCQFNECRDSADARCDCDRSAGFECLESGIGGAGQCGRVRGICGTSTPVADQATLDRPIFLADAEFICGYRDEEHKSCDDAPFRDLDVPPIVRCTAETFGPDWLAGGVCAAICRQDTHDWNDDGVIQESEKAFTRDCPDTMACDDDAGDALGWFQQGDSAADCVLAGCTVGEPCDVCGIGERCLIERGGFLPVCATNRAVCVANDVAGEGEGEGEVVVGEGEGEGEGEVVAGEGEGEGEVPVVDGSAGCGIVNADEASGLIFHYPIAMNVGGLDRNYGVRFPTNYDNRRAYPLVLVFHGDQSCANFNLVTGACDASNTPGSLTRNDFRLEGQQADVDSDLGGDAAAGRSGDAIVVYVDGRNLNLFEPEFISWDTFSRPGENPDMAFVDAVIAAVRNDLCVDVTRTFAVGFSGGGFFVDSMACYRGGFTAIATFEGGFEDGDLNVSKSAANVVDLGACVTDAPAAIVVHADTDTTVPPRYGVTAAEHWRGANGCAATTTTSPLDADCDAFDGCTSGATVFCTPNLTDPFSGDQHNIWKPEGPRVVASFFRSFF